MKLSNKISPKNNFILIRHNVSIIIMYLTGCVYIQYSRVRHNDSHNSCWISSKQVNMNYNNCRAETVQDWYTMQLPTYGEIHTPTLYTHAYMYVRTCSYTCICLCAVMHSAKSNHLIILMDFLWDAICKLKNGSNKFSWESSHICKHWSWSY